jgi:hypothetical protein
MINTLIGRRIIHHNNCTYCVERKQIVVPEQLKRGKKPRMKEICDLTGKDLVAYFAPTGIRYCDQYRQINCPCNKCNPNGAKG